MQNSCNYDTDTKHNHSHSECSSYTYVQVCLNKNLPQKTEQYDL